MPIKPVLVSTVLVSLISAQSASAISLDDFVGTYQYQGDIRKSTISKLEIKQANGQLRAHIWFYGRPDDVDWGEAPLIEYKKQPYSNPAPSPELTVQLEHGDAKSIIAIRIGSYGKRVKSIEVKTWTSWLHQNDKHQNEVAEDSLENTAVTVAPARMEPMPMDSSNVDFGPFMAELQRRIKRAWLPPRGHESDKVQVQFKIHNNGALSDLRVSKSEGIALSDRAALAAVQNAAPFGPLPTGSPGSVDVQFTFDYDVFRGGRSF